MLVGYEGDVEVHVDHPFEVDPCLRYQWDDFEPGVELSFDGNRYRVESVVKMNQGKNLVAVRRIPVEDVPEATYSEGDIQGAPVNIGGCV